MPHALVAGATFVCNSCSAKVSLAPASKACLEQGISNYGTFSQRLENLKNDGNNPSLQQGHYWISRNFSKTNKQSRLSSIFHAKKVRQHNDGRLYQIGSSNETKNQH